MCYIQLTRCLLLKYTRISDAAYISERLGDSRIASLEHSDDKPVLVEFCSALLTPALSQRSSQLKGRRGKKAP